ncbi:hypothetical protein Lepto7376_3984 [[Leptolyngbya] sp. PCC 7376]|uniref:DUF4335 domain-containing protein n=1 Tax=[Leptolyngbya] sp. PCC 7376 TaxID=111781 RepID=UPI00029F47C3|nr:DUF4335 domain-containing protein [[Leptolyngbya] sp. PCC 7376]AFY40123.1 hypothetical protein Lepto7376_3984 [[Leptolyngbya] sp. PCC 7376]
MLTPTLIRRYTPPTCSLEVVAKTSALSQWTGNPVIKELDFELSLDDPRLVTENKILLTGDRQQLEDLVEVVTDYVQNFLQQTNPVFDFAPTQNIYTYQTPGSNAGNIATIARPQLETKGLLSHRLHLGRLANDVSGQTIQLSATQLYDLANALESYSADMVALPTLTAGRNRKNVMRWGAIAASFLIVVGVSKTAFDLQQSSQNETAASLEAVEETATEFEQQVVPPDLHSSYTFTEVPELEEALEAEKADPSTVQLEAIATNPTPAGSPKPASPQPAASSAPPPSETATAGGSLESVPRPPAIANAPTPIIPRQQASSGIESAAPSVAREAPIATASPPAPAPSVTAAAPADGNFGTSAQRGASIGLNSVAADYSYSADAYDDSVSGEVTAAPVDPVLTGDRLEQTQQYFDSRWQTPEGLEETLEYRLNIDQTGNLQKVVPLGKASELYQSRLSYLATGNKIVGATENPAQTIRLVLDPDGTVQTFEE